jgi:hypothetical protein
MKKKGKNGIYHVHTHYSTMSKYERKSANLYLLLKNEGVSYSTASVLFIVLSHPLLSRRHVGMSGSRNPSL